MKRKRGRPKVAQKLVSVVAYVTPQERERFEEAQRQARFPSLSSWASVALSTRADEVLGIKR